MKMGVISRKCALITSECAKRAPMIAASSPASQHSIPLPHAGAVALRPWQQVLAEAVTDPAELCSLLQLDEAMIPPALRAAQAFSLRVPRSFVARMRPADPNDPLLLQILPVAAEGQSNAGFSVDPIGDLAARVVPGLLHKYHGRVLLVTTGACAVHCRYCFRRHFPYDAESPLAAGWQRTLDHVRADSSVREVILSGGDPLSLTERRLRQLSTALEEIPHVRRLRIHTRYPVVLPERVDTALLAWLSELRLQKVMVIHANHAQELDQQVERACRELRATGTVLLNQSVLLAGVNATVADLQHLSERLFEIGVLPYYLHLLDKVAGAAHFDIDAVTASRLHRALAARLPGFLLPRLVREEQGATAKSPVYETLEVLP
jgi:EF-P beta-lysylation protein EpmB